MTIKTAIPMHSPYFLNSCPSLQGVEVDGDKKSTSTPLCIVWTGLYNYIDYNINVCALSIYGLKKILIKLILIDHFIRLFYA